MSAEPTPLTESKQQDTLTPYEGYFGGTGTTITCPERPFQPDAAQCIHLRWDSSLWDKMPLVRFCLHEQCKQMLENCILHPPSQIKPLPPWVLVHIFFEDIGYQVLLEGHEYQTIHRMLTILAPAAAQASLSTVILCVNGGGLRGYQKKSQESTEKHAALAAQQYKEWDPSQGLDPAPRDVIAKIMRVVNEAKRLSEAAMDVDESPPPKSSKVTYDMTEAPRGGVSPPENPSGPGFFEYNKMPVVINRGWWVPHKDVKHIGGAADPDADIVLPVHWTNPDLPTQLTRVKYNQWRGICVDIMEKLIFSTFRQILVQNKGDKGVGMAQRIVRVCSDLQKIDD